MGTTTAGAKVPALRAQIREYLRCGAAWAPIWNGETDDMDRVVLHHLSQLHGYRNAYTAICEAEPSENPIWAFRRCESRCFLEFVSLFDQEAPDTVLKDFFREFCNEMSSLEIKTARLLILQHKFPSCHVERDLPTWVFLRRGPAFPDPELET